MLKGACVQNKVCNVDTNNFARYFKSIYDSVCFQPDEDILLFNEIYVNGEFQCMFEELNVNIHIHEGLKASKELNTGKSVGPDFMLNEFFI